MKKFHAKKLQGGNFMKIFKAEYTRGIRYLLADSQEMAVALSPRFTERLGILKTVYEVEEEEE